VAATADFNYELPPASIAQEPLERRDAARLVVAGERGEVIGHHTITDLADLLRPGDVVVLNTTRVMPARLHTNRSTGGAVEVLALNGQGDVWEALVRPSRKVRVGEVLANGITILASLGEGRWQVRLPAHDGLEFLAAHGSVPLPPYITTPLADPERYQTVFAERPASVAAPTAGLHLTEKVLEALEQSGIEIAHVELEVGLGTFRPITTDRVEDHAIHRERYRVPAQTLEACERAGRVVAIGTTVVRALESAAQGNLEGDTDLYIHGDFPFHLVDLLLTNFHVPRSSLLVLVEAFMGPRWKDIYREALASDYRFLSFGDAMLCHREDRSRRQ